MPRLRAVAGALALALAAATVSGCTGEPDPAPPAPTPTQAPPETPEPTPTPTATLEPWVSVIATASGDYVQVFTEPGDTAPERTVSAAEIESLPGQIPLTFLVIEQRDAWVHVHLPVRPNGSSGWLHASDVTMATTDFRIEVRLTEHRFLLHQGEEVVMDVPVGLGRSDVPTPGGVYYIKELLQPPTPGGTYGAYAYGLSGYSPVLENFAGGQGVIGIHGTNQPETVGTDASHGCIRMLDEDITRLVTEFGLPLGTPVEIVE